MDQKERYWQWFQVRMLKENIIIYFFLQTCNLLMIRRRYLVAGSVPDSLSNLTPIRSVYNHKASKRYSDLLSHIRNRMPKCLPYLLEEIYKQIMESKEDPDFIEISEKARQSQSKGSKHTGGSKPFHEYADSYVSINRV